MRNFRVLPLLLCLAGCPASESKPDAGTPPIALTHSWNVSPETSRFFAVDMGTQPPEAADALMAKLPTVMHKVGSDCQDQTWGGNGELAISFALAEGEPIEVSVVPTLDVEACLSQAIASHAEAFAGLPDAKVLVRANYMPSGG